MKVKDSVTKKLLKYLAVGSGVAVLSVMAPTLPHNLLRHYLRKQKFQKGLFLRDLKRLQYRQLIAYQELSDGSLKIMLEKGNTKNVLQYKYKELTLKKPQRWDGKWRAMMFDIPTAANKARDALRRKITELGFYQLQKSVFIHPYPCEDEIDFIGSVFNVRNRILLMYVSHFEGEEKLRRHFNLKT